MISKTMRVGLLACVMGVAQAQEPAAGAEASTVDALPLLEAWGKLEPRGGVVEIAVKQGQAVSVWLACKGCDAKLTLSGVRGGAQPSSALGDNEAGAEFSVYSDGNLRVAVAPGEQELAGAYGLWVRIDGEQALAAPSGKAPGWVRKTKLPSYEAWRVPTDPEDLAPQDVLTAGQMVDAVSDGWECGGILGAVSYIAGQNAYGVDSLKAFPGDPGAWMLMEEVYVPECRATRQGGSVGLVCSSAPDMPKVEGTALYRLLALKLAACLETWHPEVLAPTVGMGYGRELGRTWAMYGVEVHALLEMGPQDDQRMVRMIVQRSK